jgi:hypothetical protein
VGIDPHIDKIGRRSRQMIRPLDKAWLARRPVIFRVRPMNPPINDHDASLKRLDSAGMVASTLCGIHCAAMPLLIGALTAAGVGWIGNEALEWAILAGSVSIGLFALLPSYRRVHRRRSCLWLFWLGVLAILGGRLAHTSSLPDTPFVLSGAVLIVSAHAFNRYLCARCRACGESARIEGERGENQTPGSVSSG